MHAGGVLRGLVHRNGITIQVGSGFMAASQCLAEVHGRDFRTRIAGRAVTAPEWKSRRLFGVWAQSRPLVTESSVSASSARRIHLFCRVSIDGHCNDVAERESACTHDQSPATPTACLIEKRQQHPEK